MAAVLVPAVRSGAATLAQNLPSLVKTVEAESPRAYSKLKQILGMSRTDPKKAAVDVKKSGDPMMVQGLIGNMIASGVPAQVLKRVSNGLIDDQTWNTLYNMYSNFESVEREAVDRMAPKVSLDVASTGLDPEMASTAMDAINERDVNELCSFFGGISREQLARMHTKFMALTSAKIRRVEVAHRIRVFGLNDPRTKLDENWGNGR